MSVDNPFSNPPPETTKPEEKKLEQPPKEVKSKTPDLTEEEKAQYEQWLEENPEVPKVLLECEPEIARFEELVASFEAAYSLEELHLIVDLTPKDAPNHPLRAPAKEAFALILAQRNKLKEETNIAPEKFEEVNAEYKRLSRAIGIIVNNKLDHTR